ncbi:MAG: ABC transporter substrate-binding protein [Thermomicrobia bacterium]|nr:ABC transporter substrate-binding protein [Thermomicrobia bacterium]
MNTREQRIVRDRPLSRRGFLGGVAASAGAAILAACGSSKATETPKVTAGTAAVTAPAGAASTPATVAATNGTAAPVAATASAPLADAGSLTMLSTQFSPIEQAEPFRKTILANFKGKVDFLPGDFNDRMRGEEQANKVTVSILGGLHGDFVPFANDGLLQDLTPLLAKLGDRGFPKSFLDLAKVGTTDKTFYIPWMQATYIMAANKKALQYLPQGAKPETLTYAQLKDWGAAMQKGTGQRRIGFPAGPTALMHRFFQGYLYPSYTGTTAVGFKSPDAVTMWNDFKEIWQYTNPGSTNYGNTSEPMLSEEVWVGWDHIAGLLNVLQTRPNDFITFAGPTGPKGHGFMPVLAGFAIPKGAPNQQGAELLIDYLTQPQQQITTAKVNGFFPVTNAVVPPELSAGVKLEADAIAAQSSAPGGVTTLLPVGLGAKGGDFNKVYYDTFTRIAIKGEAAQTVLDDEAKIMQGILNDTKAPCWAPDPASTGACQVK